MPIGRAHANPIIDTRLYQVEFGDGSVKEYAANIIAENLYSQVDGKGCFVVNLDGIVDHKMTKDAITEEDSTFVYKGKTYPRRTTKGWELCVLWKDSSTSWEPLSDLKESYPVGVAEYANNVGIDYLSTFRWWVPFTIKRKERMIKATSKSYHKKQHKFGIELPKSVHQAVLLDKKNGDTLWMDALKKEIGDIRVAIEVLWDEDNIPVGYQKVGTHLVWNVKFCSLQRKARLVAQGNKTEDPNIQTYASVVSRDTVRIALTIAALNDLDAMQADIRNVYRNASCDEKIWMVLGLEFGL